MRNFIALCKVQFLSFLTGLSGGKKNSKKKSNLKVLYIILPLLLGGLIFASAYVYTMAYYELLMLTGKTNELIPLMLSLSVIVSLIFSFYTAVKVLYGFKDYDMLFSMPVKTRQVVLSKFVFSYIIDFLFSIIIVLPSLIWHAKFGIEISFSSILNLLVILLGAPLFSIFISSVLGLVIALVSSRAKRKVLIETLFFVAILVAYFAFMFASSTEEGMAEGAMFIPLITKTYFLYPLVLKGLTSFGTALIVLLIQTVAFVVVLTFICLTYDKIHTLFVSKKTNRKYVKKEYAINTTTKALYKKEIKRLFSSSTYVMNSLLGAVFNFIGSIVICVLCITNGLNQIPELSGMIIAFAPSFVTLFFMMAPTTNCAISLEGKSFWIIKSSPVPFNKVLNAKLLTCITFYLPTAVVSGVLIPIALGTNVITGILFFLISILVALFSAYAGLIFNLLFPMFNWDNENKPIKQSISVLLTMLAGFVLAGLFGVLGYFVKIDVRIIFAIIFVILLALTLVFRYLIKEKGLKILERKD